MIETPDGIFTDLLDINGNIVKTAEQLYKEWKENKQIDICPKDKVKTNEELQEELLTTNKIVADLEIELLS